MANYADCLVAFWDTVSSGTRNMIKLSEDKGLDIYIYVFMNKKFYVYIPNKSTLIFSIKEQFYLKPPRHLIDYWHFGNLCTYRGE